MSGDATIAATHPHPVRKELGALASFRFLAAAMVVVHHFSPFEARLPPLIHGSSYGAPVWPGYFFVLSGFILTYSYLDRKTGRMATDTRRFLRARAARILPTYWLAWLVIAPWNVLARIKREPLPVAAAKLGVESTATFLGLHAWVPRLSMAWNYPGWTISIELFLYTTFPFLLSRLVSWRIGRLFALSVVLWAAQVAMGYGLVGAFPGFVGEHLLHLPLLHLHEFVFGIVAGLSFVKGSVDGLRRRPWLVSTLQIVSLLALLLMLELPIEKMLIPYSIGALSPFFAGFVLLQALDEGVVTKALDLKILKTLGRASYAFYILQEPVRAWFSVVFSTGPQLTVAQFWVYFAVLTLVSVAVSRWFEEPARQFIMRLRWRRAPKTGTIAAPSESTT